MGVEFSNVLRSQPCNVSLNLMLGSLLPSPCTSAASASAQSFTSCQRHFKLSFQWPPAGRLWTVLTTPMVLHTGLSECFKALSMMSIIGTNWSARQNVKNLSCPTLVGCSVLAQDNRGPSPSPRPNQTAGGGLSVSAIPGLGEITKHKWWVWLLVALGGERSLCFSR